MTVKDPVCGMMIDQNDAKGTSTYGGVTYYLCSTDCKKAFDKDPARYVGKVPHPIPE